MSDIVAQWDISLSDGVHHVEFEHGTTSGKRVVRVDDKDVLRKEWMFKLVGREHFSIGKAKCCILIQAVNGFAYEYSMEVNGKSLQKFTENQTKIMKTWTLEVDGVPTRIVLEKDTLDVWVNGQRMPITGEFVDDGTETHFLLAETMLAHITAVSSGRRKHGIVHKLFVNNKEIPEAKE